LFGEKQLHVAILTTKRHEATRKTDFRNYCGKKLAETTKPPSLGSLLLIETG
jgi:hypothetical protein